jgi:hypothetical protein
MSLEEYGSPDFGHAQFLVHSEGIVRTFRSI